MGFSSPDTELQKYLHIRRAYGIVESVGVPALETLVGSRVFEVQGVVKGTMRTGKRLSLLLERTDGQTEAIDADAIPEWAVGSDAPARLIVKATRTEENGELQATLISVAREEDVRPIELRLMASSAKSIANRRKKSAVVTKSNDPGMFGDIGKPPAQTWQGSSDEKLNAYAAFIYRHNPKLGTTEPYRIARGILGYARRYGVDARLIVAMVICESDFNPNEVSHSGAMGLGQLMPGTVQDYGITNPFDSVQNLYGTVREIRSHIDKYQNQTGDDFQALVLGLAAYNAGEGAVKRHGGIPPYRETQSYVRKVIKLYYKLAGYK
jgi:hypothetical protein